MHATRIPNVMRNVAKPANVNQSGTLLIGSATAGRIPSSGETWLAIQAGIDIASTESNGPRMAASRNGPADMHTAVTAAVGGGHGTGEQDRNRPAR